MLCKKRIKIYWRWISVGLRRVPALRVLPSIFKQRYTNTVPCVFVFEHLYLCVWVCPFVFVYLYLESASIHLEAKIPPLSLPTVKGIGYLKVELNMLNAVNLYLTNQL